MVVLKNTPQITDVHCGPAVVQSMFAFLNKNVTQKQVVRAGKAQKTIRSYGMPPTKLAEAVEKLSGDHCFKYAQHTEVDQLAHLVTTHNWPVVVNWQGFFYENDQEEAADKPEDVGHYSIVVGIDQKADTILIADPYPTYAKSIRKFSLAWFEERWWDNTIIPRGKKGSSYLETKRFMFTIAPHNSKISKLSFLSSSDTLSELIVPQGLKMLDNATKLHLIQ